MSEINQFPSRVETGLGENQVSEIKKKEFKPPHPHGLTPFQKLVCVVELIGVAMLIYLVAKVIVTNVVHLSHVLH